MQPRNMHNNGNISEIVKNIALLVILGVLTYKAITTPIQISLDLPTIISLGIALFAIYLSSLFYFKATDTSNLFYDNTYKFTKDIAELLVRMESGFGERLRHLDESYTRIQGHFERSLPPEEIAKTQEEAEKSRAELEAKIKEREKLIEELANRAKLQGQERESILKHLSNLENELTDARQQLSLYQDEIGRVKHQQADLRLSSRTRHSNINETERALHYLQSRIIPKLDPAFIARAPDTLIDRRWRELSETLPPILLHDLQILEFIDANSNLTNIGRDYLRNGARHIIDYKKE